MKTQSAEKVIESAIQLLSEFFPQKTYLYFPLLSASLVWAIKRSKEWKEKIFNWMVWPEPGPVRVKSDEFILNFFRNNGVLLKVYKEDVEKEDLVSLRQSFYRLYPIFGLQDPFLSALFQKELENDDCRKIAEEFDARLTRAKNDVEQYHNNARLLQGLKEFATALASLGSELLTQTKVQKVIKELVERKIKENHE